MELDKKTAQIPGVNELFSVNLIENPFTVTHIGENWNSFWQDLELFDSGFREIVAEEDC